MTPAAEAQLQLVADLASLAPQSLWWYPRPFSMPYRRSPRTRRPSETSALAAVSPPSRVGVDWANVLASLDDAVIVTDTTERVTFLNPAAENLTGSSARQACNHALARLFPFDGWIVEMARKTLATGDGCRHGGVELADPGRPLVPVAAAVSPVLDAAGRVEGAVLVIHDVSYWKDLEEASRYADRAASLELLSSGLAHEIKNPLGAIKGAAQLLEQTPNRQGQTVDEHTAVIVREVDRLTRLLDELLDIAHPPPLTFELVNIHKVLDTVLGLARQRREWQETVFVPQFDPSLPEIRANESKLVQVFLNLVINALQAMGGKGTLTISTRIVTDYHLRRERGAQARFLAVEVEDTGPGIAQGDLENLFASFFTTKPGGTGLGLAICQQIITQHAGRIWVLNRPRGGAIARVLLPMATLSDRP